MNSLLSQTAGKCYFGRSVFPRSSCRCHAVVSSLTNWLVGANKLLKTLSDLICMLDVSQECVQNHLIKLLVKLSIVYSEVLKKKKTRAQESD